MEPGFREQGVEGSKADRNLVRVRGNGPREDRCGPPCARGLNRPEARREGDAHLLPVFETKGSDAGVVALTLPQWHQWALEGTAVPMRIQVHGNSMFPLIRIRRDYVTIHPLAEPPAVGDIVLFADPERNRYVLHRLWRVEGDRALTWGDNCPDPDGWMPLEALWGKAVLIERGGRLLRPDPRRGMRLARFWHRVGGIWRLAGRCKRALLRRAGRLFPGRKKKDA